MIKSHVWGRGGYTCTRNTINKSDLQSTLGSEVNLNNMICKTEVSDTVSMEVSTSETKGKERD